MDRRDKAHIECGGDGDIPDAALTKQTHIVIYRSHRGGVPTY
jgi:hypothetical protein